MKNDPAFPCKVGFDRKKQETTEIYQVDNDTLRDYFAATAMQELSSSKPEYFEANAKLAYQQADAMLKEREK